MNRLLDRRLGGSLLLVTAGILLFQWNSVLGAVLAFGGILLLFAPRET